MEATMTRPGATLESAAAAIADALLRVHRQERFAGVLEAVAKAGPRLGAPSYIGCLLRDPGIDGWYLTAMLDSTGRAAPLERLGLSTGPFPFAPRVVSSPIRLAELMGEAWGPDLSALLERRLGVVGVISAPIEGSHGPQGALLALVTTHERADLLAGLLVHGATAAARHLEQHDHVMTDGVLDPHTLADLAGKEIARAERYRRELAVVLFETDSSTALGHFGPTLVRSLRRWDLVGRPDGDRPQIIAVLPETGRGGGRGLLRRLNGALGGIRAGIATFPDDGGSITRLVEVARTRIIRSTMDGAAHEGESYLWARTKHVSRDSHSVNCPSCATVFVLRRPVTADERSLAHARRAALSSLQSACPRHPDQLVVTI